MNTKSIIALGMVLGARSALGGDADFCPAVVFDPAAANISWLAADTSEGVQRIAAFQSYDSGNPAVIVRRREPGPSGAWLVEQVIPVGSFAPGQRVALRGTLIAAGNSGLASMHLYRRVGTTWAAEQSIVNIGVIGFGTSLAVGTSVDDGADVERLAVGAPAGAFGGTVWIYRHDLGGWTLEQTLSAPMGSPGQFGTDVALDGKRLLVGAPGVSSLETTPAKAFVFVRDGTTWSLEQALEPNDGIATPFNFGARVAMAADHIAVARSSIVSAGPGAGFGGAVSVYHLQPGGWVAGEAIDFDISGGKFGESLSMRANNDGTTLAIGQTLAWLSSGLVVLLVEGQVVEAQDIFMTNPATGVLVAASRLALAPAAAGAPEAIATGNGGTVVSVLTNDENDCDGDGWSDQCQISIEPWLDCDGNGVLDSCEIALGLAPDVNGNGLPDACEGNVCDLGPDGTVVNGTAGGRFGAILARDGDTLAVVRPDAPGTGSSKGVVDILVLEGGTWNVTQSIAAPQGALDRFGIGIALSGDSLAVVERKNTSGPQRAWGYRRTDGLFGDPTLLVEIPSIPATSLVLGVAASGGDVAVAVNTSGAAQRRLSIFEPAAGGEPGWTTAAELFQPSQDFGTRIGFDGDWLIAAGGSNLTVYKRTSDVPAGLVLSQTINSVIANAVSIDGDRFAVGVNGANSVGGVRVYKRVAQTWTLAQEIGNPDGLPHYLVGSTLSLDGPWLVAGAPLDNDTVSSVGKAWIFHDSPDNEDGFIPLRRLGHSPAWIDDRFSNGLSATKLDDGGVEVLAGAPGVDLIATNAGAVFMFEYALVDCNDNGLDDECEIAFEVVSDSNGDGVPDRCGIPADLDGNGIVDGGDLGILLGAWGTSGAGDLNGDGTVDGGDLGAMLAAWGSGG